MIERHVTDVFTDVVARTSIALNRHVNFMFGDVNEVVSQLNQLSMTAETVVKKYPLIALFTDIEEQRGTSEDIQSEMRINTIVIATFTKNVYFARERIEKSFKPVLIPIYLEFLKQIDSGNEFKTYGWRDIQHTKLDRLSWGKSALFTDRGAGTDFIDAIEIRNLNLKLNWKICKN
jgi:hypothetical protein